MPGPCRDNWWQSRSALIALYERPAPAGNSASAVRYGHASEHDPDMARTRQNIHALVGIACMREDLLILFVPGIHLVPVQGQVALDRWSVGQGTRIAPGRMFGHAVADADRPVRRLP